MRRLLLFMFAIVAFAACEQAPIEEAQGVVMSDRSLEVSFEGANDTRIQLQGGKTVWTEGDHVSVFYRSSVNEEWQFMGETGDRTGQIVPVDNSVNPPATHNRVVVIYPYNNEYYLNTETYSIEASLPAVQNHLMDSYGTNGNIMVSSNDYKQVLLKSVCGWLKLQLTGDGEEVKSITLRGNDGEQVAGELHINTSDATCVLASASGDAGDSEVGGTLVRPGTILTEVTLDCGEGVTLGKNATAFYIALPPQTFEHGFTVEIEDTEGYVMEQSTDKALTIERNHIQPMAALEFINPNPPTQPTPASNEIWYTSSDGNVVTPYNTNAFGATIISNEYNNGLGVITFDVDVTSIGDYAFVYCESLTTVNIPDSVTTIGEWAFASCGSLKEFKGKYATEDGRSLIVDNTIIAYANASGNTYNIPDSVTTIGDYAFFWCTSLTSVTIPDSVTAIGDYAFEDCASLTSVNIPDSVTKIGNYTFGDCASLTSVNIPDSVTTISNSAFFKCTSLTSVTIGNGVTSIENGAFYNCTSLTSVYCYATIPPSLASGAFYNNASGLRIYVYEECVELYKSAWSDYKDSIYTNGQNCPDTTTIEYTTTDGNIVTPENMPVVSNIYNNGVGTMVYSGKQIPNNAFGYCISLTSVTIPDSVTTIGNSAFNYCTRLTSVNIPDSVTTIGVGAFDGCTSLTCVYISDIAAWCNISFSDSDSNPLSNGCNLYLNNELVTDLTIPDSVTTIGYSAFYSCDSLTSVNIGDSVTTIGGSAFSHCESLTTVNIPDSVTTIGAGAFGYCDSLTSVNIGDNVTTIGNQAFYKCTNLTSVNIPDSVTTIGYSAFCDCTNLTSVTIGDSVTAIGYSAFEGCTSLTSVNIPDSVTTIGGVAFYKCTSLTSVNIPDSVTTIGYSAFCDCTNLTSVTIPDSVTTIGDYAFYGCSSLTSVTIPDSVTTIEYGAFGYCDSLTSVYCKATTPPSLGYNNVFDNNGSGRKIYVPTESVDAYKSATNWSEYASAIVGYDF